MDLTALHYPHSLPGRSATNLNHRSLSSQHAPQPSLHLPGASRRFPWPLPRQGEAKHISSIFKTELNLQLWLMPPIPGVVITILQIAIVEYANMIVWEHLHLQIIPPLLFFFCRRRGGEEGKERWGKNTPQTLLINCKLLPRHNCWWFREGGDFWFGAFILKSFGPHWPSNSTLGCYPKGIIYLSQYYLESRKLK